MDIRPFTVFQHDAPRCETTLNEDCGGNHLPFYSCNLTMLGNYACVHLEAGFPIENITMEMRERLTDYIGPLAQTQMESAE